ncbi:stage II sporulation protein M [Lutispora saccharofermentans]|uniref:Stage II sporulation protein M n=1 Tax=Lutispora saccharofermentans TaxID=3024236 RepID=A0ABT1NF25_9FIRM|nr:stage II sporulation protein M [Lutispora saccharofermentans]MCQ1529844.1 stage II sporulation protein M [Lutispora saccharofermentans]
MFGRLNYAAAKHIRENGIWYLCFFILFSLGISFGAFWVSKLSIDSKDLLIRYVEGFFNLIPGGTIYNGGTFRISFINNMIWIVMLFISGFTYLGAVVSPLYMTFKGFCFGFSVAFLVESFGRKGLIFSLISLLPHSIVLIPGTIFLCTISFQYSLFLLKSRNDKRYETKRQSFASYIVPFAFGLAAVILSSIIESYITPVFIRSLSVFII